MVFTIQRTDRNPRAKSARSCTRNPIGNEGLVKDLPTVERALTIFGGLMKPRVVATSLIDMLKGQDAHPRRWCTK